MGLDPRKRKEIMRSTRLLCVALLIAWTGAPPIQAADQAKPPGERELRGQMNKAEKQFFELYNRLNQDPRQAMLCANEERSGSRLRGSSSCRTRAETEIAEEAAREYIRGLALASSVDTETATGQQQSATSREVGGPVAQATAPPAPGAEYADKSFSDTGARIENQRAEFDRHLKELLERNPELQQRLNEYLAARQRYEAARHK